MASPPPSFDLQSSTKRNAKRAIPLALVKLTHAQELTLYAIYAKIVKLWEDAEQRITAAYAVSLNEHSPNGPGDAARAIDATAAEASILMIMLPTVLTQWASRVEKVHQAKWVRAVLAATKIDIGPMLAPSDMSAILKASADWNASLVRDVSEEVRRRISTAVFTSFQSRGTVYDLAKEISKATGLARRRSRNIALDQTRKLGEALNRARMKQSGITHFRWRHGATLHARKWHLERNGKVFPLEGPGSIDPSDMPSIPPFCSCSTQAVVLPAMAAAAT